MSSYFKKLISSLPFIIPIFAFAGPPQVSDPCRVFIQYGYKTKCQAELEKDDLALLTGKRAKETPDWLYQDLLTRLCDQIEKGDSQSIAVGFRLCILMDGEWAEDIKRALGEATGKNSQAFLTNFQAMIDLSKKANHEKNIYDYLKFVPAQNDLEYAGKPHQEIKALQNRKIVLGNIKDPSVQEAKSYSLKVTKGKT